MSPRHAQLEMEPVYGFFYGICRMAHQMFFRGEASGLSNLPASGGYIVAANHASLLDPPIVGQFLPRQVNFFARKTLWKPGLAAWWLDAVGTIPVDRDGGVSLDAIKRVLHALAGGNVVIVFPEGTRSRDGELQPPGRASGSSPARRACRSCPPACSGRSRRSAAPAGCAWARRSRWRSAGRSPRRSTTGPADGQGALRPDRREDHGGHHPHRAPSGAGHLSGA